MTRREMDFLERVFAAEVEGRLPFQARPSKLLTRLAEQQYIQPMRENFGPVVVEGWQLTHAGRFLYCSSCPDPEAA